MRYGLGFAFVVSVVALGCGDDGKTAGNDFGTGGGAASSGAGGGSGGLNLGGSGNGGSGQAGAGNGTGSGGDSGYCGSTLTGTIRDFMQSHPDFEYIIQVDPGIVLPDLGADNLPVYAGQAGNPTTTGQANFDQWYRDVPGVNQKDLVSIPLTASGGNVYTYSNNAFFPIDNKLFGNEGNNHNFHFTFELHTKFVYLGGEVFTFTGDDDLFVFVNKKLAIDLGGVHGALNGQVDLDANASQLGITKGTAYQLDFFFAERHTSESNFRIDTTIGSFVDCGPPPVR
jgi:fibro-slime domain-containing protein